MVAGAAAAGALAARCTAQDGCEAVGGGEGVAREVDVLTLDITEGGLRIGAVDVDTSIRHGSACDDSATRGAGFCMVEVDETAVDAPSAVVEVWLECHPISVFHASTSVG